MNHRGGDNLRAINMRSCSASSIPSRTSSSPRLTSALSRRPPITSLNPSANPDPATKSSDGQTRPRSSRRASSQSELVGTSCSWIWATSQALRFTSSRSGRPRPCEPRTIFAVSGLRVSILISTPKLSDRKARPSYTGGKQTLEYQNITHIEPVPEPLTWDFPPSQIRVLTLKGRGG